MIKNVVLRKVLIAMAIGIFSALIFVFAFNAVYKNSRLGDSYFLNYSLKNMNHKDVENFVSSKINPLVDKYTINVHFEGKSFRVNLKDIGGHFQAGEIFHFGKSKDNNEKYAPTLKYNEKKLEEIIKYFSEKTKIEPTKFKYKREEDKLNVQSGMSGKQIDIKGTVHIIKDFLHSPEFMECLKNGNFKSINAESQELVQDISTINLEEIKKEVDTPVKDASLSIVNGERVCEKEKQGVNLDLNKAKQVVKNPKKGEYTLPLQTKKPSKTTKDIENDIKNIKTPNVLGSCTTYFSNSKNEKVRNRNENIKLAANAVNGTVLLPGEWFSFGKKAGNLSGYKEAPTYINGKVSSGVGGGICQVSSTIFGGATQAGVANFVRAGHTRLAPYLPPGKDATFDSGGTDFKFQNTFSNPIKIVTTTTNNSVTAKILGTDEGYRGKLQSETISDSNNILKVLTKYTITKDGKVVKTKNFYSTYNTKKDTEAAPSPKNNAPAAIATPDAALPNNQPSPPQQNNTPATPPAATNPAPTAAPQSTAPPASTPAQPSSTHPTNTPQTNTPAPPPATTPPPSTPTPPTPPPKKEDSVPKVVAPATAPVNLPGTSTAAPPIAQKIEAPILAAPQN